MPIVNVRLMEGVLSKDEKKALLEGIRDAVVKVYGAPMRLFLHVVLEEVQSGDWFGAGSIITSDRVKLISPNVGRPRRVRGSRGARKRTAARPAKPRG
jgi:phenylpyruvate tautomerase PptA (4-oxalocrotonate tautomerase family)